MIRIVNLRNYFLKKNEILIKVDRSSPVGNIFVMHTESERDKVCDQYDAYFKTRIANKQDYRFMDYLKFIYTQAKTHDIALGCWCAPKRCHAETIKTFIENLLLKEENSKHDAQ